MTKFKSAACLSQVMGADLLIINGGTGVARRYILPSPALNPANSGFGEAFPGAFLQEIGTGLASRHRRFNLYNQLTYCLPGSPNACQTASIS